MKVFQLLSLIVNLAISHLINQISQFLAIRLVRDPCCIRAISQISQFYRLSESREE